MKRDAQNVVSIGLSAAIVSVADETPRVLVVHPPGGVDALPFGPFDPLHHRTLESGLRSWVGGADLISISAMQNSSTPSATAAVTCRKPAKAHAWSRSAISRLPAATQEPPIRNGAIGTAFSHGKIGAMPNRASSKKSSAPVLKAFAKAAGKGESSEIRRDRARLCFGLDGLRWDEEKVLERYELLYEAGIGGGSRPRRPRNEI